ncbi:hypothetical protein D3C86_1881360 [compost metagenome]
MIDRRGFPQIGVGHHDDRTESVVQLHHMGGLATVGPGLGEVLRIFEMERGIEAGVGRCVLIFQIEFGQLREGVARRTGWRVLEVFAQRLLQLHPIQQQVIALPGLFIP